MGNKTSKQKTLIFTVALCCVLMLLSTIIITNQQSISDYLTVQSFKPSIDVLNLADRSGLNDSGKFIYLASRPILNGTQTFNDECESVENIASILGCYSNGKIYIYDVSDSRLDGIREVTATHETLHAIYARLGNGEKSKINELLQAEYEKIMNDQRFKSRMDFYNRTEPGQLYNELHSVIGTEISDINPELEEYFSKYFSDRQKVVALNNQYLSVFTELDNSAKSILESRDALIKSIEDRVDQYNSDAYLLDSDINDFNNRAANAQFSNQLQFDNERNLLVTRKNALSNNRASIMSDIDKSDEMINKYNSITTESKKLYTSLDSSLAPAPSI